MHKKLLALLAMLVLAFALTACGDDEEGSAGEKSSSIAEDEEFNQADVDFATEMIQHHAQALTMVDMVDDKTVSPEFASLAEQIRMTQGPEIETWSAGSRHGSSQCLKRCATTPTPTATAMWRWT